MTKLVNLVREALEYYRVKDPAVIEAVTVAIKANATYLPRFAYEAVHHAWGDHEGRYGAFARFTPRGSALRAVLDRFRVNPDEDRRAAARPSAPPAPAKPARGTLTLPKRRAAPAEPVSDDGIGLSAAAALFGATTAPEPSRDEPKFESGGGGDFGGGGASGDY